MAATSEAISDEALASTWSDSDLTRLSRCIVDWESIAPVLSITEAEEREIKEDNPHDYQMQKYAMLRKWKVKAEGGATYKQLIRVFHIVNRKELVEHVHDILLHPEESATASNILACYQEFLKQSYCKMPHPSLLPDQWPVMRKPTFVNLSLTNDLSLPDLFAKTKPQKSDEHHRVLLCGLPGSGKTTLTWHVSQLWAKKELFLQFTLFLAVPLRSRQVQQATCLADIILHPDQEQRKAIAQALSTSHGDGICFWFDGWDEMPEEIQKQSFIASFIRQDAAQCSLPGCTIAVTSRSETQYLEQVGMPKVDIESLNRAQVEEMVVKNTEGTGHDANELLTAIESKAALSRFCSLPITVTILIHLFFTLGTNIPTTQTELFRCLILNLLLRNLQTRWLLPVKTLESFDSLREFASKSFRMLCKLAYDGIMQKRAVFRPSDIPNLQLPLPLATLGLMRINPHIEWFGMDEELTFIHSTVQEFLAAYHLSLLPSDQHVSNLNQILKSHHSPHSPVISFFGGLTKFEESKEFLPNEDYYEISLFDRSFFSIIESLYEANSPSLCQFVTDSSVKVNDHVKIEVNQSIAMFEWLTPAHMVPLGYFVTHVCSKKTCTLNLLNCHFVGNAAELFVKTIISELATVDPKLSESKLELFVAEDHMSKTTMAIGQLVRHTNIVKYLKLHLQFTSNFMFARIGLRPDRHAPRLSIHTVMPPLIGGLSKNTSLKHLCIKFTFPVLECPTTALMAYTEYYLVLLLTCCPGLMCLDLLELFPYRNTHFFRLLSAAIKYNKNLEFLGLHKNYPLQLYESNFNLIANGIGMNRSLKKVFLVNSVNDQSLLTFLKILYMCGSVLKGVAVDIKPSDEVQSVITNINVARDSESQPLLLLFLNVDYVDVYGNGCYQVCNGAGILPYSPEFDYYVIHA